MRVVRTKSLHFPCHRVTTMAASASSGKAITVKELRPNDVLLGRGPGLSHYEGNLRFRRLVDERRFAYVSTQKRKDKGNIAKEIFLVIRAAGGRFVKQVDSLEEDESWYEVDDGVAIEKTKQALREHREPTKASKRSKPSEQTSGGQAPPTFSSSNHSSENASGAMDSIPEAAQSQDAVVERQRNPLVNPVLSRPSLTPITSKSMAESVGASSLLDVGRSTSTSSDSAGSFDAAAVAPSALAAATFPVQPITEPVPSIMPAAALHPVQAEALTGPSILDPRLLLFQNTPFAAHQQTMITQSMLMNQLLRSQLECSLQSRDGATNVPTAADMNQEILQNLLHSANVAAAATHQRYLADNAIYSLLRNFALVQTSQTKSTEQSSEPKSHKDQEDGPNDNAMEIDEEEMKLSAIPTGETVPSKERRLSDSSNERRFSDISIDEELSAFLLSSLAVSDRPVITEEQEAFERATLTNEEKATVLSDTFGKMCESDAPQKKRARLDLDRGFVAFLLKQMRIEIENIPRNKKLALIEAQMSINCHRDEFSDARLEKFLRCEGMNVKVRTALHGIIAIDVPPTKCGSYSVFLTMSCTARSSALCQLLGESP